MGQFTPNVLLRIMSKDAARRIFRQTLDAIDVGAAIERALARDGPRIQVGRATIDLDSYCEIVAVAFGKVSCAMARAFSESLEHQHTVDGILVTPSGAAQSITGWKTFEGGHPVPNQSSFAAGRAILERLSRCDTRSLVFFLISGGGSSLVEQPLDSAWTLGDFRALHETLVTCGAPIAEINVVRKHVSATKGGRLATAAPESMKVTLAVSDVPPGEESALASGPTLPDRSTLEDAIRVVRHYGLLGKFPARLREAFEKRALTETPKAEHPAFARAHFVRILGEHDLLHAAHRACEAAGYMCVCDTTTDNWPVEKAAGHLLTLLETQKAENPGRRVAVLAGGEVSSPVTGTGMGGRNSAFVLASVRKTAGKSITVLSAGTDGIDGNSPAAGAVADGESLTRAAQAGMAPEEYFAHSDAYAFFDRLGDAVVTGTTGNNLRDLRVLLFD